MEKKMTYAVAIDKAIAGELTEEVIARLGDLKVKLAKPSETRAKKASTAQDGFKEVVKTALEAIGKPATVTEILATGAFEPGTSSQKITAALKKMVEVDGTVAKTVDKKKSYFALVESEDAETEE